MGFWKEVKNEGALLNHKIMFFMGDGRRLRFWKDKWCKNIVLSVSFPSLFLFLFFISIFNFFMSLSFPSLYVMGGSKEVWVVEFWDSLGEEGGWILSSLGSSMIE